VPKDAVNPTKVFLKNLVQNHHMLRGKNRNCISAKYSGVLKNFDFPQEDLPQKLEQVCRWTTHACTCSLNLSWKHKHIFSDWFDPSITTHHNFGCILNMMSFQGFSSLGDQSPIILLTNLQSTMHDLISQSDDHHKLKKDLHWIIIPKFPV
jgi:hypothetical protein